MEQIFVFAYFAKGKIYPKIIVWNKKIIKVEKITYHWKSVSDESLNLHFSILSGSFYYHIIYSLSSNRWYLVDTEIMSS